MPSFGDWGKLADVGLSEALFLRQTGVADDAVGPEFNDLDFQLVLTRLKRIFYVHPPRRASNGAAGFAVHFHFSHFSDVAQIQHQS